MALTRSLTLFFVVEPPDYQMMACHLAASIRKHMPPEVTLIGYCPAARMADLDPHAVEVLRRLRCTIRPIETEGRFDPPYPHGNKILAALDPKDTDFAAFLDSDMLMLRDCTIAELTTPGRIGVVPSTSMRWAGQEVWDRIWAALGEPLPEERIELTRDKRVPSVPYFNAGLIVIDERWRSPDGRRFAEVWMDCARILDAEPDLDNKRPYLDQMTLPVAIRKAGMDWAILPERYNYSIGGIMRGKPIPETEQVTILHYRRWSILQESGYRETAKHALAEAAGTRRINWVFLNPPPPGIDPPEHAPPAPPPAATPEAPCDLSCSNILGGPGADSPRSEAAARATPSPAPAPGQPDPSKARVAAITMVHQDHIFLDRWVRYYADQIGRENLYVLRHGPDPEIDRIAAGTNIVALPNPADQSGFDRRRWAALSAYASGLTLYYNWVLCNDVDEIVAVDPALGQSLPDYLDAKFAAGRPPAVISPFAVEIVHTPALEPEPITPDRPILSVRRHFRVNSNYAKPCLTRRRIAFSIGGHGSTTQDVALDPHLYLFHLRYMDEGISRARLSARKAWAEAKNGPAEGRGKATWDQGTEVLDRLSALAPVATTIDFPDLRRQMIEGRSRAATGNWFFRNLRTAELYRLPDHFAALF